MKQEGEGDKDEEYHLMIDGLVKSRRMIYVPYSSELKNLILREFHTNSYSSYRNNLKCASTNEFRLETIDQKLFYSIH